MDQVGYGNTRTFETGLKRLARDKHFFERKSATKKKFHNIDCHLCGQLNGDRVEVKGPEEVEGKEGDDCVEEAFQEPEESLPR